jgi:hypothetical protein
MEYSCEFCEISFKRKGDLVRHNQSIKCKEKQNKFNLNIKLNNNILNLEKELEQYKLKLVEKENKIKELTEDNNKLNLKNNSLKLENETLKSENKSLEKSNESFRNIVEKSATKSTKTVNTNTYNRNNYLNYVSSEPIRFGEIQQKINNLITTKTIMYDTDNFNNYITKNILKDENGKNKVLCTDINRKNFTYKDETSGQMICDPELEKLREKLKNTSHNSSVKKDLLDTLISKYEGTGIDPYLRFYECLQNIEYGQPFVEHVAKKTYVKGQSISQGLCPKHETDVNEYKLNNDCSKGNIVCKTEPLIEISEQDEPTVIVAEEQNSQMKEKNEEHNPSKKYDDIDIDTVNINEIEDIELLDMILDKYEKKLKMLSK